MADGLTSVSPLRSALSDLPSQVSSIMEARDRAKALATGAQQEQQALDLSERRFEEVEKPTLGIAQAQEQRLGAQEQRLGEHQAFTQEVASHADTNFGHDKVAGFKKILEGKGVLNAYDSVLTDLDKFAGAEGATHRTVYNSFKERWPLYRQSTLQSLEQQYRKERDPVVSSKILMEMKMLSDDTEGNIIDQLMPTTAQQLTVEQTEAAQAGTAFQKTGSFIVRDPATGQTAVAVGSFDPSTGTLKTETAELSGLELVSELGETGQEETAREVGQVAQEAAARGTEAQATELIARGVAAAESTATIRRAIDLLDSVDTGGFSAVAARAKQIFGVESADEGELSNTLGKAVLSQLRETFGAAFTEAEGSRLARIEAAFTKSPETNKRLLAQALRIAENTAQRARAAAVARGDEFTVNDIDDLLSFSLTPVDSIRIEEPGETLPDSDYDNLSVEELIKRAAGVQ